MGEMVTSRYRLMLSHLEKEDKFVHQLVKDEVNEFVLTLEKIEKLFNDDRKSRKVMDNKRKIRNLVYTIEDALEPLAVNMEVAFELSKKEKKRGITGILITKCFCLGDKFRRILHESIVMFVIKSIYEVGPLITRLGEVVLTGDTDTDIEPASLEHRKSLYDHGMEEHFVEKEENLEKLVDQIASNKNEQRVFSILGAKGLGKTTLARNVYTHHKTRSYFKARFWVSFDQDDQIDNLLQSILDQLKTGAVKKNAAENKENLSEVEAIKTSAKAHKKGVEENKKGAEDKNESAEEQDKGADEKKESAEGKNEIAEEQEKGADEKKEGADEKDKAEGADEKNKVRADEKKEGADDNKKVGADEKKEGAEDKNEIAEEQEKGADEKNKAEGADEKNKVGAGEKKEDADDNKKVCADEKNEGAEDKTEIAEEQEKGADEKNKAEGADEKKEGADEKNKDADDNKKVGADEKKEGAEDKNEIAEEQEKGAVEKKEGADDKKEGVGAWARNHLHNMMKRGAGRKSAEDKNESAEEHKKGAHEKKEGGEEQPKSSEETVMEKLKKIPPSESCLIVIDGISKSSQWNDISSKFQTDFALTKFLLTTEKKIAGVEELYEMKPLDGIKGWELLKKYAFHGKKAPVLGLGPKLGKEMARKCEGIPSKISSLGRSLRRKRSFSEWREVNNDIDKYLDREAHQSQSNETSEDLILSYDSLSYYQKECFLYLAIFKEDECVDPEDVSFLWIAEGFCSPQQQKQMTVMDTTEEYLQVLASMLRMQVDELSRNWFMPFPLYNYARELSLHLGNEEDFRLKVVDFSGGKQPRFDPYTLSEERTRRLVIHFNRLSSPMEQDMNATDDLRSLLFLNSDHEYVNLPVKISDFSAFMLLRVLHFVRCKFEGKKLPQGILKLLNLRYLGIIYCDLESLPSSISNVRNLHVLNVRAYIPITIPNFASEMHSLKHLRLPHNSKQEQEISEELKLKLNGLLHLETLDGFNADIHDLNSLSELEKLRHLSTHAYSNGSLESIIKFVNTHDAEIRTNLVIESKCDLTSPEGMSVLEEVLLCPNLDALTFFTVVLRKIPNCGEFASERLTKMKLIGCKLSEDPMEALGKFPNLRKLWLGYGAFVGTTMAIRDGGFPNLEYLEFRCLPNLEEWTVDKGAMKKLSILIVTKCPKLKTVSDGLEIDELPPTVLAEGVWPRDKSQHQVASCSFT